jgi:hypothetical protein
MSEERKRLLVVWAVSSLATATIAYLAYRSLTAIPEYAGRTEPSRLLEEPTLLFHEPGILGTAVEVQVTEAIETCMAEAGYDYRAPSPVDDLDSLRPSGYGIATGGEAHRAELGPGGSGDPGYEVALYGSPLNDAAGGGGCAAVGEAALAAAMGRLDEMPYSLSQLEQDALAHPAYQQGVAEWASCMAGRGHDAATPDEIMESLREQLSSAIGDDARSLAMLEEQIADDDYTCRRRTIDAAMPTVARDLAPGFVEMNRPQLEELIPVAGSGVDLPSGLGSGDVQVTLLWEGQADLDLFVTDPNTEQVSYSNTEVSSGGRLDRDARFPCGSDDSSPAAENIFWPTGEAPSGTYRAEVHYTTDCAGEGAQSIELIIQVNGRVVERARTSLDPADDNYVVEFRVSS